MKKPINEEFKRMQTLAGINENVIPDEGKTNFGKANFGPFKNVEWYSRRSEGKISLIVTNQSTLFS